MSRPFPRSPQERPVAHSAWTPAFEQAKFAPRPVAAGHAPPDAADPSEQQVPDAPLVNAPKVQFEVEANCAVGKHAVGGAAGLMNGVFEQRFEPPDGVKVQSSRQVRN